MRERPQSAMGEDHRFLLLLTEKSNNSELGCRGQLDMKWKDKFRSLFDQFLNAIRALVLNPQSYWIWKMKTLLLISCLVASVVSNSWPPYGLQARQDRLSRGSHRQEYWSELPFPSPGDLPPPRNQTPVSYTEGRFFTIWATREAPSC